MGSGIDHTGFSSAHERSGLSQLEQSLDISIRGRDAIGPAGEFFFGDESLISKDAVRVPVFVPRGSWLISAQPKKGFGVQPWWQTSAGIIGLFGITFLGIGELPNFI